MTDFTDLVEIDALNTDTSNDNIAEPTLAEVNQADEALTEANVTDVSTETNPDNESKATTAVEFFTLLQAGEFISRHYDRGFKQLRFTPPQQIVDGCAVEFLDGEMNVIVATARLRLRNSIHIDKESGAMLLDVALTDLSFARGHLDMTVRAPGVKQ